MGTSVPQAVHPVAHWKVPYRQRVFDGTQTLPESLNLSLTSLFGGLPLVTFSKGSVVLAKKFLTFFLILVLLSASLSVEVRLVCQDYDLPLTSISDCCCLSQTGGPDCDSSRMSACCCDRQIVVTADDSGPVHGLQSSIPKAPERQVYPVSQVVFFDAPQDFHVEQLKFSHAVSPRSSPAVYLLNTSFLI